MANDGNGIIVAPRVKENYIEMLADLVPERLDCPCDSICLVENWAHNQNGIVS
jgi:hypothetical protein